MKQNKREWVKTFAIIFLSVLLVLTFFSNTILNMSLPEVSTQYIQYGTLKTQVRGSGTVVAEEDYSVTLEVPREIERVHVKSGDAVKKGDLLLTLTPDSGTELETAEQNYENLNYEYTRLVLESSKTDDYADERRAIEENREDLADARAKLAAIESGEDVLGSAKTAVREAEKAVASKQAQIDELKAERAAIGYTPTEDEVLTGKMENVTYEEYAAATKDIEEAEARVKAAETAVAEAENAKTAAQRTYDRALSAYNDAKADLPATVKELEESIKTSDRSIETLDREIKYLKQEFYDTTQNRELEKLYDNFKDAQNVYRRAKNKYDSLRADDSASADAMASAKRAMDEAGEKLDEVYDEYKQLLTAQETVTDDIERNLASKETELQYALEDNAKLRDQLAEAKPKEAAVEEKKKAVDEAAKALEEMTDAVNAAQTVLENATVNKKKLEESLSKTRNGYKYVKDKEYETRIKALETELEALSDDLDRKKEQYGDLQSENSEDAETLKTRIKTLERSIASAESALSEKIEAAGDSAKLSSLELQRKKKDVDRAAADLAKMRQKYAATEVRSSVNGIVENTNVYAGRKAEAGASLIDISLEEKGYRLTITASRDQAAKLRVGMAAEVTGYIGYGNQINVTLDAIKNDTANRGSNQKILEFLVTGDVTNGQSLSVAVGDKNASYDNTVPNTAIREDSNGKYILIVEAKQTPISTRYKAKRVDVTVLASDDTRSAISGDFDSYAYVIATSSKPINDGEQVKLVDG